MPSTLSMRPIANPQRTTLAHLGDADELAAAVTPQAAAPDAQEAHQEAQETRSTQDGYEELPPRTANPRRTVLVDLPTHEVL